MLSRVCRYIEAEHLFEPSDRLLVGLSGGVDSVVLTHILLRLGMAIEAVHCNFHLRGDESDRDESFVREFCTAHDIALHVVHFDTLSYAREHGISVEMAARDLRYEQFGKLREQLGCEYIAVAHHQNDQAETLLLNLRRGTGLRGLCGMRAKNGRVVRPLLELTRQEIADYADKQHLAFVEDSTNADTSYRRNAIRQQISKYSQSDIRHIAHTARLMQDYVRLTDAYIATLQERLMQGDSINIPALLATPAPQLVLYELLKDYGFQQHEAIFATLSGQAGKQFESDDYILLKDRDRLLVRPKSKGSPDSEPVIKQRLLDLDKPLSYPAPTEPVAFFDSRLLQHRLTLRHCQTADRFVPIGMRQHKKIFDFLTDMHVPLIDKQRVWLLCADDEIAWVVGYRISDRFKITDKSKQAVEIKVVSV